MTTDQDVLSLVSTRGVQVAIGPFLVRVRSNHEGVRHYLETFYSGFPMRDSSDAHFDVAILDGRGARRWLRPQAVVVINGARPFFPLPAALSGAVLEWGLNWCIGRDANRWVALHAAVVERDGQAMILPAEPGSGKSTLAAALGFAGWRFLSDEFALIEPATGLVWPLPRPISLKEASIDVIRARKPDVVYGPEGRDIEKKRFVHARPAPESIARMGEPARPAWVVTPRWVAGSATNLEPMTKARALVRLADQSFNYNYLGPAGFIALSDLVARADCFTLEYSDLDDAIPRLTRLTWPRKDLL